MNDTQKILVRIQNALADRGITQTKMMKELSFSSGLFTQWRKEYQKPKLDSLKKIATYLKLPIEYLVSEAPETDISSFIQNHREEVNKELSAKQSLPSVTFDDFTYAMYDESRELTDEQKKMLLDMARMLRERQHREGNDKQ